MPDDLIPQEIQQFILQNIDSIAELEALLLLKNHPESRWDVETVAQRLYIETTETERLLTQLVARGLCIQNETSPPAYRYAPATPELRGQVDRLAELYARYLVPVTHLVHTKPKSRIQEFSDAFRLRKE